MLRNWLKTVDRICREVWQSQGERITPEFVREILVPEAMTAIGARIGVTNSRIDRTAAQTHRGRHTARHHLAMEVNRLQAEVANRYEIEVRELEYRIVPAPAVDAHREGKQQKPLTRRELKMWAIIQRGTKGLQYCRELDKAGVAPLRRGAWKDCPRKYESAYLQGKLWCHRIEDEKFKVKRKAKLAGLEKLASE